MHEIEIVELRKDVSKIKIIDKDEKYYRLVDICVRCKTEAEKCHD